MNVKVNFAETDLGFTPVMDKTTVVYGKVEKAEWQAFIIDELAKRGQLKPEFVQSLEELEALTTEEERSKLYVLLDKTSPNHGYIYAYMYTEVVTEGSKNYANTFETGRLNSNGNVSTSNATGAVTCIDYITLSLTERTYIKVKGYGALTDYNVSLYNSEKVCVNSANVTSLFGSRYSYDEDTGIVTLVQEGNGAVNYLRISGIPTGTTEDIIITINEEIKESTTKQEYSWVNTGHAFIPADYEDRIIKLEVGTKELTEATNKNAEDITELNKRIEDVEEGNTSIPEHWKNAIANAKATISQKQALGGVNCVNFAWTSDIHANASDDEKGKRLGIVAKAIMDEADIPLFVSTGDIMSQASYNTPDNIYVEEALARKWLSPIPYYQQALIMGNHDGAWGDSSCYYYKQLPLDIMYNLIYRKQAMDFRRVSGDNGTYYYLDNESQKMRYIFLNTHNTPSYEENTDGTAKYDRFHASCYCQTQLDWVANVALDMPEGYIACIFAHAPYDPADKSQLVGIVDAYNGTNFGNGKGKYNNTFTDSTNAWRSSTVDVDFSNAKGEIIAVFTGHVHKDTIDTTMFSTCPLITMTTSLGGDVRDLIDPNDKTSLIYPRTGNTDTEFAMDIVTVDTKNRKIYMTRLGAGVNREVSY